MKRILCLLLSALLLLPSMTYAEVAGYSDVSDDHWAYDAIMYMTNHDIISGYGDGTFRPNVAISRGEFATIMVKALALEPKYNVSSSFVDLDDDHWVLPYVEVAKSYLTGYNTPSGMKFKPDDAAVREDMAVAIIAAKGFKVTDNDKAYLSDYADLEDVSENLRNYVGSAVRNGIMIGDEKNGQKVFSPQDSLTRAQAAALLYKMLYIQEEKVVLGSVDFTLSALESNGGLLLSWGKPEQDNIKGYKVVASMTNTKPAYPEDGYVMYLGANERSVHLSGKIANHNGDSSYLEPGKAYYFTITALYDGGSVTTNAVKMTYPDKISEDLTLEAFLKDNAIVVEWSGDGYDGYKVVASRSNTSPIYPYDGYYKYVGPNEPKRVEIPFGASYNNGDISQFNEGTYYLAITGLKGNEKISSNVVKVQVTMETPVVKLYGTSKGDQVVLEWTDENDAMISGFKVVASEKDSTPIYPESGYYQYIKKGEGYRSVISLGDYYNNGDFSKFEPGKSYYFSITALYGDQKIASNVLKLGFDAAVTPEVTLSAEKKDDSVLLKWVSYKDENVEGFKVVASKGDASPMYPENGYYKYLPIGSPEEVLIQVGDHYNGGDFDYFEKGQTYYFSITTLHSSGKTSSNTIKVTF